MGENENRLDSGKLYFCRTDNGAISPLSQVTDYTVGLEGAYETMTKEVDEFLRAITGMYQAYINCCPDRRVVHLALHGKTARIRKKNFNRAIKILEDLDD